MRRIKFGFTLIELLVAIGIVAVVSAGLISLIGTGPRKSANDARRKADVQKFASYLELYRTDTGHYPECHNGLTHYCQPANTIVDFINNYEGSNPPNDPFFNDASKGWVYRYNPLPSTCDNGANGNCTQYQICISLEKPQSTPAISIDATNCGGYCDRLGGSTPCYVLTTNP